MHPAGSAEDQAVTDEYAPEEGSLSAALLAEVANGQARDMRVLRAELGAALAREAAVRKLHREGVDSARGELIGDGECRECEQRWPCPTIRALDAATPRTT